MESKTQYTYEMKQFYCHACQHRTLVNIMEGLRCGHCGSEAIQEANSIQRNRQPQRQTNRQDWNQFLGTFANPLMSPFQMFEQGFSHFGRGFTTREQFLLNNLFDMEPTFFTHDRLHSFFNTPQNFFAGMQFEDLFHHLGRQNPNRQRTNRNTINALPVIKLTQEHLQHQDSCPVCQENLNLGEEVKQLPCKHYFHGVCIEPWLRASNTCPMCRTEIPNLG